MAKRGENRRARREYSLEFKQDAVALMQRQRQEGRPVAAIARDLGIAPTLLRYWERALQGDVRLRDHQLTG